MKFHLLSYPRSGNHLFRAFFEHCTRLRSCDCIGSEVRHFEDLRNSVTLWKSHFVREVLYVEKLNSREINWGLILLLREPADAISSHLARSREYTRLLSTKFERNRLLLFNIDHYLALIDFYEKFGGSKQVVLYENMLKSGYQVEIQDMGLIEFSSSAIRSAAKSSQRSLIGSKQKALDEVVNSGYYDLLIDRYRGLID